MLNTSCLCLRSLSSAGRAGAIVCLAPGGPKLTLLSKPGPCSQLCLVCLSVSWWSRAAVLGLDPHQLRPPPPDRKGKQLVPLQVTRNEACLFHTYQCLLLGAFPHRGAPQLGHIFPEAVAPTANCEVPRGWASQAPFFSLAEWKGLFPLQPPKPGEELLLELLPGQPPAAVSACDRGYRGSTSQRQT